MSCSCFLPEPHVQAVSGGGGNRTRDACCGNPRHQAISALKERDGDRCFYCEQTFPAYHLDHVQPRSRGGGDQLANRVLACGDCNLAKRDWPAWLHVFYAGLGLTLPPNTYRVNFGRYLVPWCEPPALPIPTWNLGTDLGARMMALLEASA